MNAIRKMKTVALVSALCLGTSCHVQSQDVQKEERQVPVFQSIAAKGAATVYVEQGSPQRVRVEAPADVLKDYETEVDDGTLILGLRERKRYKKGQKITVYITVERLERVRLSGSGEVMGKGVWKADDMSLALSGSGDLRCEVMAKDLDLSLSGSGDMNVQSTSEEIEARISGSGEIALQGESKELDARISGSGDIRGADFKVLTCDVSISGSGTCSIAVEESLDASISGSGKVYYTGSVDDVDTHVNGSGKVVRAKK